MITLENDRLLVEISEKGAELSRIYDKVRKQEVLYDADPKYWNRHAPVLFPFVGTVTDNTYTYGEDTYQIRQHGFARDMVFETVFTSPVQAVLSLHENEDSYKVYPFAFELTITHTLEDNRIETKWEVEATNGPIIFKIGGHPAFRVPIIPGTALSDYTIDLGEKDVLNCRKIIPGTGVTDETMLRSLPLDNHHLHLSEELFADDALVIDEELPKVTLCYPDGSPYVTVLDPGFPNFGIWKKPEAPFVCLEPWCGRTDTFGSPKALDDKSGFIWLDNEDLWEAAHTIIIH